MSRPIFKESAWELAKANSAAVYQSSQFNSATTGVSVLAGATAVLLTFGGDAAEVVAASVIAGLGAIMGCLASVLFFQAVAAPLRQRNELRRLLSSSDQLEDPEVLVALTDFSRRADDLLSECRAVDFTARHEDALETWTREVVEFFGRNRQPGSAQAFALASKGSGSFLDRLESGWLP